MHHPCRELRRCLEPAGRQATGHQNALSRVRSAHGGRAYAAEWRGQQTNNWRNQFAAARWALDMSARQGWDMWTLGVEHGGTWLSVADPSADLDLSGAKRWLLDQSPDAAEGRRSLPHHGPRNGQDLWIGVSRDLLVTS